MKQTKKIYFLLFFIVLGFILSQIKFTQLVGANIKFSLFDFFAPVAGSFLGAPLAILTVLFIMLVNLALSSTIEPAHIIRLFPILFGIYFFSQNPLKKPKIFMLFVPAACMLLFWAHPEGRKAWVYALFWTVPLIASFRRNNLYLRSLGATLTTHAVGSVAWAWAFNLPSAAWIMLIPITASERLLFAGGISIAYVIFVRVLRFLTARNLLGTPSLLKNIK